jgi:hypothetical protein
MFLKANDKLHPQRNQPTSKEPFGEAVPTKNIRKRNVSTFLKVNFEIPPQGNQPTSKEPSGEAIPTKNKKETLVRFLKTPTQTLNVRNVIPKVACQNCRNYRN